MNKQIENNLPFYLFQRYDDNPILTTKNWPYPANAVFNPGAVEKDGQTILLARVEDIRGFSHLTRARSPNGFSNWEIDAHPTLTSDAKHNEEQWGVEDPRVVYLADQDKYAVTYVSFSKGGPVVSIAMTNDFTHFERLGCILPPEDKDASIFPRQIGGRYMLIHRPIIRGEADIWISFSPDLKYWGEHRVLLPARPGWWDNHRVGLGPPPIETPEGWLIIYHGVRMTASGSLYRLGLALLDRDDPCQIIHRSDNWVFGSQVNYEYMGDVPGVTFPTGVIVNQQTGDLRMYYGAADKSIAVATSNLNHILDLLRSKSI